MSSSQITFNLGASTERACQTMVLESIRQAVEFLSDKYGFDQDEAMHSMKITRKEVASKPKKERKVAAPKRVKPSIPLPFCEKVFEDACCGIRVNHGLHTQCNNAKVEGCDYCKTCGVQAATSGTDKPNAGDIRDRISGEWVASSKVVSYGNVMEKLGITRDEAERVASEFGMTIPEEQFEVVKGRRGRPKKDPSASSSDDDEKPKRPRGRPKSSKKVVSTSSGDDLISQLVASASAETSSGSDSEPSMTTQSSQKSPVAKSPSKEEKDAAKAKAKAEKEAAKAAAKAEKEAAKAKAKAEKEAAKAAAKAEKEAAKAKAKAEKEAAKAAAKAKKDERPTLVAVNDTDDEDSVTKISSPDAENTSPVAENTVATPTDADLEELKVECFGSESEEESDDEIVAEPFEFEGKTYARDAESNVYDIESSDLVGTWNDETEKVEFHPE